VAASRRPGARQRWLTCRARFFLPVRVLSSLFRRLFLEALDRAFRGGELIFHGNLVDLNDSGRFARQLRAVRRIDLVGYAKAPFGGPEQVLYYFGRYTHRVTIANSRLTNIPTAASPSAGRITATTTARRS